MDGLLKELAGKLLEELTDQEWDELEAVQTALTEAPDETLAAMGSLLTGAMALRRGGHEADAIGAATAELAAFFEPA